MTTMAFAIKCHQCTIFVVHTTSVVHFIIMVVKGKFSE